MKTSDTELSNANTKEGSFAGAEWALLVECLRPNFYLPRVKEMLRGPVNWPLLFEMAAEHGVLALFTVRLQNCGETGVPPEISQDLRERYRAQVLFTMRLTAEMFRLLSGFAAAGLEALVIKGPVLSVRCHDDPGLRRYGDLDLIVRDGDILRTTEVMVGLGYEPRVTRQAIQAKKAPGEYAFRQTSAKLLVEFHTERTFRYHPRLLPVEKLFQRKVLVRVDAHEIPALSLEDELLLICIHGAKHFWERLHYIADVAAFVSRQELDCRRVESAAEEVGAQRMLYTGLRLAQKVLGAQLPENISLAIRADPAIVSLAREIEGRLPAAGSAPPGIFARAIFRMRMRGGILAGPAYLLRLSFSPTEEDWVVGTESKRPRILEALKRPFRLARKYGNAEKP